MQLFASAASHTGKIRKNNEDNLFFDGMVLPQDHQGCDVTFKELSSGLPTLVGVFDGMGGHDNGELASYLMASEAKRFASQLPSGPDCEAALIQLCLDANDLICDQSEGSMMGTTAAMICFSQSGYTVCNVGDSPVFLWRKGKLVQLSEEHTQRITYERTTGKKAPPKKKFPLTQCIGIPREELLIEPFCAQGQLRPGDIFLLCSDGVTDMLSPETICAVLGRRQPVDQMVSCLISGALEAGGRDNITAICVQVSHNGPVSALIQRVRKHIQKLTESPGDTP